MVLRITTILLGACSVIAFSGCTLGPYQKLNAFGAKELLNRSFEEVQLIRLLVGSDATQSDKQQSSAGESDHGKERADADKKMTIDEAFLEFHNKTPKEERVLRRNSIQERLLAASAQRCGAYFRFLNQFDTEVGFSFGALATALAGAGAIVTPATAARALSGTAGITSGVGAEFQENFFSKLTVQVITKGISERQRRIYEDIKTIRNKAEKYEEYPVEAAVKDALLYHAACNLVAGLEEAGAAIERAKRPGITEMMEVMRSFSDVWTELEKKFGKAGTIPPQVESEKGTKK